MNGFGHAPLDLPVGGDQTWGQRLCVLSGIIGHAHNGTPLGMLNGEVLCAFNFPWK